MQVATICHSEDQTWVRIWMENSTYTLIKKTNSMFNVHSEVIIKWSHFYSLCLWMTPHTEMRQQQIYISQSLSHKNKWQNWNTVITECFSQYRSVLVSIEWETLTCILMPCCIKHFNTFCSKINLSLCNQILCEPRYPILMVGPFSFHYETSFYRYSHPVKADLMTTLWILHSHTVVFLRVHN